MTELDCFLPGNSNQSAPDAKAFGEWQNPAWVRRLAELNDTLANFNVSDININVSGINVTINVTDEILNAINASLTQLLNMSQIQINMSGMIINVTVNQSEDLARIIGMLGNLSSEMNASFNITWDKLDQINATLSNMTTLIREVGQIANSSVDRNDSLLALLLFNLTRCTACYNTSGQPLLHIETADPVVYWSDWNIVVMATDNASVVVAYPDSYCQISTTFTGLTMMTPSGTQFTFTDFIKEPGDFTWTVNYYRS